VFPSQKKVINGLTLVPETIYAADNESFINLSFSFVEMLTYSQPEISFKVDSDDYTIKLVEVTEKFPFDEGVIEIGGMPVKIIQSQKKEVKGLLVIPVHIKEDGNDSYVNLSVSFSRNLDYEFRIGQGSGDSNQTGQEQDQDGQGGGYFFYILVGVLVVVFAAILVYIFFLNK